MQSNKLMGMVYSINRYSVHDGPGIRQTIFFKGCPLMCWWCHNPESQSIRAEVSYRKLSLEGKSFTQEETIGQLMSADEIMKEIEKDQLFFDESDGGVTFSGGEPLMQHKFLEELLQRCKNQRIHTTVDTCGHSTVEVLERIANLADLFLFDLKHMDNQKHKKYTGVQNNQIIRNLLWLDENKKNTIIRFPVIPGINDDEEHITQMLDFLSKLKHIRKISLLPYHSIADHKYQQMNKVNKMQGVKSLQIDDLKPLIFRFESIGFDVKAGN